MAKDSIFRKKTVDKLNAPDQLDNYTKGAHPSLWIFLVAMLCIVSGFAIWSLFGEVQVCVYGSALVQEEQAKIVLKAKDAERVDIGQVLAVNETESTVKNKEAESFKITEEIYDDNKYLFEIGNFVVGDWITIVYADVKISNGSYTSYVIVENIRPIHYIFK